MTSLESLLLTLTGAGVTIACAGALMGWFIPILAPIGFLIGMKLCAASFVTAVRRGR